jgi:hypothetical protein
VRILLLSTAKSDAGHGALHRYIACPGTKRDLKFYLVCEMQIPKHFS